MIAVIQATLSDQLREIATWFALALVPLFGALILVKARRRDELHRTLSLAGLALQALLTGLLGVTIYNRGVEVGHQPWQSWYEVLILCSAFAVLSALVLRYALRRYRRTPLQVIFFDLFLLVTQFVTWLLLYLAAGKDHAGSTLPPALKSYWFAPHVVAYVLSYAMLLVVCAGVITWWLVGAWVRLRPRSDTPEVRRWLIDFDGFAYTIVAIGFPFLTLALILGSLWGQDAWGRYWGWDAKEVCALVTWLIYVLYLHLRLLGGWRGARLNLLLFAGGVMILVTFLFVQYLPASMTSLHKYV